MRDREKDKSEGKVHKFSVYSLVPPRFFYHYLKTFATISPYTTSTITPFFYSYPLREVEQTLSTSVKGTQMGNVDAFARLPGRYFSEKRNVTRIDGGNRACLVFLFYSSYHY